MTDRSETRRQEDRDALDYFSEIMRWIRRGPRILIASFSLLAGTASTAAWLGAKASSPAQRIARLEIRVDSGFAATESKIVDLRSRQIVADSMRVSIEEKVDLLLRMGCRQIQQSELIRACDRVGARR